MSQRVNVHVERATSDPAGHEQQDSKSACCCQKNLPNKYYEDWDDDCYGAIPQREFASNNAVQGCSSFQADLEIRPCETSLVKPLLFNGDINQEAGGSLLKMNISRAADSLVKAQIE